MPKKALKAKKAYQLACYLQAKDGKMNDWDGSFKTKNSFQDNSMRRDYFCGYHLERGHGGRARGKA